MISKQPPTSYGRELCTELSYTKKDTKELRPAKEWSWSLADLAD